MLSDPATAARTWQKVHRQTPHFPPPLPVTLLTLSVRCVQHPLASSNPKENNILTVILAHSLII